MSLIVSGHQWIGKSIAADPLEGITDFEITAKYAHLIVNKFFEKYTPDKIKEMSTVDLEAAFIETICDLAMDENYFLKNNTAERPCAWKACAPIVGSAFKIALEENDQSS